MFVDFAVGPIKTDISIKISSREITMDTMVPACVTHHLHRHCKRIESSCDEVYPPGTWGYQYPYVCIIYVGMVVSTNIFTMKIIRKDITSYH